MAALLYSTIPTIFCLLWGINRKLKEPSQEAPKAVTMNPISTTDQLEDDERENLIKPNLEITEQRMSKYTNNLNQTNSDFNSSRPVSKGLDAGYNDSVG